MTTTKWIYWNNCHGIKEKKITIFIFTHPHLTIIKENIKRKKKFKTFHIIIKKRSKKNFEIKEKKTFVNAMWDMRNYLTKQRRKEKEKRSKTKECIMEVKDFDSIYNSEQIVNFNGVLWMQCKFVSPSILFHSTPENSSQINRKRKPFADFWKFILNRWWWWRMLDGDKISICCCVYRIE